MVSFTARFTFAPEDRDEIAEVLRLVTSESRREPGCVTYIPHHVEGDPDTIVIYEQYKDAAALAAHRDSAHFKKYASATSNPSLLSFNSFTTSNKGTFSPPVASRFLNGKIDRMFMRCELNCIDRYAGPGLPSVTP
jgi:quinol monooxygenase YgiN